MSETATDVLICIRSNSSLLLRSDWGRAWAAADDASDRAAMSGQRGQPERAGDPARQHAEELELGRYRRGLDCQREPDEHRRMDDERPVRGGRHAPRQSPQLVVV